MKTKNKFATSAMLILMVGLFSLTALAQHADMVPIGKKGVIPFDTPVRVGDTLLKAGSYQFQHVMEGQDHLIVLTKMSHPDSGQPGGASVPKKEVTRLKCRVETLGEKAKHNGMRFGTNAAGEKTLEEVHIKGENVKHLF